MGNLVHKGAIYQNVCSKYESFVYSGTLYYPLEHQ